MVTGLLNPDTAIFIDRLGFPIFMAVLMTSLFIWMMKKDEKRQQKSDEKYTELVNEFISSIKTITKEQSDSMQKIAVQLESSNTTLNNMMDFNSDKLNKLCDDVKAVSRLLNDKRH